MCRMATSQPCGSRRLLLSGPVHSCKTCHTVGVNSWQFFFAASQLRYLVTILARVKSLSCSRSSIVSPSFDPSMIWSHIFFSLHTFEQNLQVFDNSRSDMRKSSKASPVCWTLLRKLRLLTVLFTCLSTYRWRAWITWAASPHAASLRPRFCTIARVSLEKTQTQCLYLLGCRNLIGYCRPSLITPASMRCVTTVTKYYLCYSTPLAYYQSLNIHIMLRISITSKHKYSSKLVHVVCKEDNISLTIVTLLFKKLYNVWIISQKLFPANLPQSSPWVRVH